MDAFSVYAALGGGLCCGINDTSQTKEDARHEGPGTELRMQILVESAP